jgi:tetratricopeptide (TPR) repeat protein
MRIWQGDIEGAHKRDALQAIDWEADNVRGAWRWALAHGSPNRLADAISCLEHWFYWRSRFHEAEQFFESAARAVAQMPAADGGALRERVEVALAVRHANFSYLLDSWDAARAQFEQALVRLAGLAQAGEDVREDEAYVLMKMGDVTANLDEAEALFSRSLALYREVGHRWWSAGLCAHLGFVALARGDTAHAQRWFDESLATYSELGDRWQFGWVYNGMSHVALAERRLDEAERLARESLALHREMGLRDRIADSLTTLSWITLAADKTEESRALRQEALDIWRNLGIEDRVALPAGLEDQPLTPRWFAEVIDQRMAAVEGAGNGRRAGSQ